MKTAVVVFVMVLGIGHLCECWNAGLKQDEPPLVDNPLQVSCNLTGPDCWRACADAPGNGLWQFCGNCTTYVICDGAIEVYGECPGGTVWDQYEGGCRETSETCHECYVEPKCTITGPTCINNCTGLPDGAYQSCRNCSSYARCTGEVQTFEHCPPGLVWQNNDPKGCAETSETCRECFNTKVCNSTGPACINDCDGLADGNYQSCDNCFSYRTCTGGVMDNVFCGLGLYWEDNGTPGCLSSSTSCNQCQPLNQCGDTGADCTRRCYGEPDGFYQSCANCTSYMSCTNQVATYIPCDPPTWLWDNSVRSCLPTSNTCQCNAPLDTHRSYSKLNTISR